MQIISPYENIHFLFPYYVCILLLTIVLKIFSCCGTYPYAF